MKFLSKIKNFCRNALVAGTLGFTALYVSTASAAPTVTAVTTEISDSLTPIGSIGSGVLLVMVGIKVFKWIQRAM